MDRSAHRHPPAPLGVGGLEGWVGGRAVSGGSQEEASKKLGIQVPKGNRSRLTF